MTDKALHGLRTILDLMGSDMWLLLDEVSFTRHFGTGELGLAAAKAFADREQCVFIPDKGTISGRFGRANYYWEDFDGPA